MDNPGNAGAGVSATVLEDEGSTLFAVLIGLREDALLLPNAAMAEVLNADQIHPADARVPGNVGSIIWHGYTIPVIDFEQMAGCSEHRPMRRPRVVVLHALNSNLHGRAYAVLSEGQPQLIPVNVSSLRIADLKPIDNSEYVLSRAKVSVREVVIPNLEYIESLLTAPTATST